MRNKIMLMEPPKLRGIFREDNEKFFDISEKKTESKTYLAKTIVEFKKRNSHG